MDGADRKREKEREKDVGESKRWRKAISSFPPRLTTLLYRRSSLPSSPPFFSSSSPHYLFSHLHLFHLPFHLWWCSFLIFPLTPKGLAFSISEQRQHHFLLWGITFPSSSSSLPTFYTFFPAGEEGMVKRVMDHHWVPVTVMAVFVLTYYVLQYIGDDTNINCLSDSDVACGSIASKEVSITMSTTVACTGIVVLYSMWEYVPRVPFLEGWRWWFFH